MKKIAFSLSLLILLIIISGCVGSGPDNKTNTSQKISEHNPPKQLTIGDSTSTVIIQHVGGNVTLGIISTMRGDLAAEIMKNSDNYDASDLDTTTEYLVVIPIFSVWGGSPNKAVYTGTTDLYVTQGTQQINNNFVLHDFGNIRRLGSLEEVLNGVYISGAAVYIVDKDIPVRIYGGNDMVGLSTDYWEVPPSSVTSMIPINRVSR